VRDVGVRRGERDDRGEQLAHARSPAAALHGHAQGAEAGRAQQRDGVVRRAPLALALRRALADRLEQRRELGGARAHGDAQGVASSTSSTAASVPSSCTGGTWRRRRKWRALRISSS
jgi:hypothetical protein